MYQYSFLTEVHPIVANAWKNNAVKSALIGGAIGGTVNKMRGDSFTKGALVGGGVGVAANGALQTGKMMSAVNSLKKTQGQAQGQLDKLVAKGRRLRSAKSIAKNNELIDIAKSKLNRTFATQLKRDNTAKALKAARKAGDKEAIYKIVDQSHKLMNRPDRILKGANIKGAHDAGYIASLRKNRRV